MTRRLAILALSFAATSQAWAAPANMAHVTDFDGKILISNGHGFVKAASDLSLSEGNSIFIGKNSKVTIAYEAGNCAVTYTTPQTLIIGKQAPCKPGTRVGQAGPALVEPANLGAVALIAPSQTAMSAELIGMTFFAASTAVVGYHVATQSSVSAP